jgi:hypothetical protein
MPPEALASSCTCLLTFLSSAAVFQRQATLDWKTLLMHVSAALCLIRSKQARPVWKGIPYRLHAADLQLTVPEPVNFHTDLRVAAREEFNKHMAEKMRQAEVSYVVAGRICWEVFRRCARSPGNDRHAVVALAWGLGTAQML